MATFYIRTTGSDSNDGLTPATAWQTLSKALGSTGISSGDGVIIGAGTYREVLNTTLTNPVATTLVQGDVSGQFTGDPGPVIISAFTAGDTSAPSASALVNLQNRNNLTFQNLHFVGGTSDIIGGANGSTNIRFVRCSFEQTSHATNYCINLTAAGTANWDVFQCHFFYYIRCINVILTGNGTADYNANVKIAGCTFVTPGRNGAIRLQGDSNTFGGGGVNAYNCTYFGSASLMNTTGTSIAQNDNGITNTVQGCLIFSMSSAALNAATAGQIVSNGQNKYISDTALANVTGHASDYGPQATTHWTGVHFGQEMVWGEPVRPFLSPMAGSPVLGWGTPAVDPIAGNEDASYRQRPSGGQSTSYAAGAYERHDTAVRGTTVPADSGSNIEIVGPGDHDFELPVDATATTVSVKVRTSGYSGTNYPTIAVTNGQEVGVSLATTAATSTSASSYETIAVGPFTPTRSGVVTIRLRNRTANSSGVAAFDSISVS